MTGLWADGWFYLSAAGFLISSVLFVFLLGQYRAAIEAEDDQVAISEPYTMKPDFQDEPPAAKPAPRKTLIVSSEDDAPVPLSPAPKPSSLASAAPAPAAAPAPLPAPEPQPAAEPPVVFPPQPVEKKKPGNGDSTGSMSPAVVLLQDIKKHMDKVEAEVDELRSLATRQADQNQAILEKLAELGARVESAAARAVSAPAPAPEPAEQALMRSYEAAEPARRAEPEPEPEPEPVAAAEPEPEPERPAELPPREPARAPASTSKPEEERAALSALIETTPEPAAGAMELKLSNPQGAGAASEPAPSKPSRKGPVWPI